VLGEFKGDIINVQNIEPLRGFGILRRGSMRLAGNVGVRLDASTQAMCFAISSSIGYLQSARSTWSRAFVSPRHSSIMVVWEDKWTLKLVC
jgi:hypothetical protein